LVWLINVASEEYVNLGDSISIEDNFFLLELNQNELSANESVLLSYSALLDSFNCTEEFSIYLDLINTTDSLNCNACVIPDSLNLSSVSSTGVYQALDVITCALNLEDLNEITLNIENGFIELLPNFVNHEYTNLELAIDSSMCNQFLDYAIAAICNSASPSSIWFSESTDTTVTISWNKVNCVDAYILVQESLNSGALDTFTLYGNSITLSTLVNTTEFYTYTIYSICNSSSVLAQGPSISLLANPDVECSSPTEVTAVYLDGIIFLTILSDSLESENVQIEVFEDGISVETLEVIPSLRGTTINVDPAATIFTIHVTNICYNESPTNFSGLSIAPDSFYNLIFNDTLDFGTSEPLLQFFTCSHGGSYYSPQEYLDCHCDGCNTALPNYLINCD